jgi:hypothetical protein
MNNKTCEQEKIVLYSVQCQLSQVNSFDEPTGNGIALMPQGKSRGDRDAICDLTNL